MADGTTTFGVDTARYQPLGTYDRRDFEIVNVEDPQLAEKVDAAIADGVPWGAYLWVYPGHDLNADGAWAVGKVRALGHGDGPAGLWADYEEAGINESQLHAFFAATDAAGVRSGYYSGPHAVDHSQFMDRDWWNAAYPTGAVEFPGYGSLWATSRPRPMSLWQYTSGGGLDRDVVVDDAWWAQLVHSPAPVPPPPPQEDDDMALLTTTDDGETNYHRLVDGYLVKIDPVVAVALGALDPNVPKYNLGGILAAIAWNAQTDEARKAHGLGVSLTDAQLEALAAKVAEKVPSGQAFHFEGTGSTS